MRTIEKTIYTIGTHPNKESVFDWIRDNWFDLNDHVVEEIIDSFKQLEKETGCTVDYSISQIPDQGEYIKVTNVEGATFDKLRATRGECPLTGVCWDVDVLSAIGDIEHNVLTALHESTEFVYSDEGLTELCEANGYEFYESGEFYRG